MVAERWRHTGAILAGGRSTRMGRPKHALPLPGGATMLEAVATVLGQVCARLVVVGEVETAMPCVADLRPGLGPLAGIEALLASGIDSEYLVCPCDLPDVTPALLRGLLEPTDAPATAFRGSPLPARITATALPAARALLDRGEHAVHVFLREVGAHEVEAAEPRRLDSINTPADYEKVLDGQDAG